MGPKPKYLLTGQAVVVVVHGNGITSSSLSIDALDMRLKDPLDFPRLSQRDVKIKLFPYILLHKDLQRRRTKINIHYNQQQPYFTKDIT